MLRCCLVFFYCLSVTTNCFSQQDIREELQKYMAMRQPEKAYVHSNQYRYSPGERIFYKVYLVANDIPSNYTRNVYGEWYDQDGKYLQRQVLPTLMGLTVGDFQVPEKYKGQRLYLKLFTAFMQQPTSMPFLVTSFIINQAGQELLAPDGSTEGLSIQVRPEGGYWVKGVPSLLTIRTTNAANLPLSLNCRIIDANGESVNLVSTAPYGYGQVEITPASTGPYYIQAQLPNGTWAQQKLPDVQPNGTGISFDPQDFSFILHRTPEAEASQQRIFMLLFHNNELLVESTFSLEERIRLKGRFIIDSLPAGFHRLVWLDGDQKLLGQRIIYLQRPATKQLALATDTLSFEKGGQNVFTLQSLDTIFSSLSVSITDADYDEINSEKSIYQLMGGDIFKSYPFNSAMAMQWLETGRDRDFDQWLQAQDIWYPAMTDQMKESINANLRQGETGYIQLYGKIENLTEKRTKKAGSMNLILSAEDNQKELMQAELAADGSFGANDLFYYDSVNIYLQPNGITVSDQNKISLRSNLIPANPERKLPVPRLLPVPSPDSLAQLQQKYAADKRILDSMASSGTLQEVVVTTRVKKRIDQMDEKYTTGFFSSDGIKFDIVSDNIANVQPNVFSYLQGRVAGLQISTQPFGPPTLIWRRDPVAVFLNEIQLQDPSVLNNIPMSDVAYVKVFRPPFLGASLGGSGGAIAVYTRRGDEGGMYDVTNLKRIKLEGYSRPTNWESSLSDPEKKKKPVRDIRKTLYWNPSVQLDKDVNQFVVRFSNNDVTKRFRIIAEGLTKGGDLIRLEKLIEQ